MKFDKSPADRTMHYGSDVSHRTVNPSLHTVKCETDNSVIDPYYNSQMGSSSMGSSLLETDKDEVNVSCMIGTKDDYTSHAEEVYKSSDLSDQKDVAENPKMTFETTHRTDMYAHSISAGASELQLRTSRVELCMPQTENSGDHETLPKEEKVDESVDSPGTPLMDEQPYSPSLNMPDCIGYSLRRKCKFGAGETEPKTELCDSVNDAISVDVEHSLPLYDVTVNDDSSIVNLPNTGENSNTPPLVTEGVLRSQTSSVLEDGKKTSRTISSGVIESAPVTESNCSVDTGATKTEFVENKLWDSGDNFLLSGPGINSLIADPGIISDSIATLTLGPVTEECASYLQESGAVAAGEEEKVAAAQPTAEFIDNRRNLSAISPLKKQSNCEKKCTNSAGCQDISGRKDVPRRHSNSSSSSNRRNDSGHRSNSDKSDLREKKVESSAIDTSSHERRSSDSKETDRKERSHSSSSSDRKHHCSKCYKRSKIKRASIGVQCRRDKTVDKFVKYGSADSTSLGAGLKIDYQTKHFSLPRPLPYNRHGLELLKYGRFIRIETYANGGATVVHMYQDEIDGLNKEEMEELVQEYFKVRV